jgi:hypothetical protein
MEQPWLLVEVLHILAAVAEEEQPVEMVEAVSEVL